MNRKHRFGLGMMLLGIASFLAPDQPNALVESIFSMIASASVVLGLFFLAFSKD